MDRDLTGRISPWINWGVILVFGPLIAFFLADLCGFEANRDTLQVILLVEICLLAGGVIVLLMVQAFGPWVNQDYEAQAWLRVLKPAPGSLLEEVTRHPNRWNGEIDRHLRAYWREVRDGTMGFEGRVEAAAMSVDPLMSELSDELRTGLETVEEADRPASLHRRPPPGRRVP